MVTQGSRFMEVSLTCASEITAEGKGERARSWLALGLWLEAVHAASPGPGLTPVGRAGEPSPRETKGLWQTLIQSTAIVCGGIFI